MFHHLYDFISVAFLWLITTSHTSSFRLASFVFLRYRWRTLIHIDPSVSEHECNFGSHTSIVWIPPADIVSHLPKIPFNVRLLMAHPARNGSPDNHQHRVKYKYKKKCCRFLAYGVLVAVVAVACCVITTFMSFMHTRP